MTSGNQRFCTHRIFIIHIMLTHVLVVFSSLSSAFHSSLLLELKPAHLKVQLIGLEARIEIEESCHSKQRMAEFYTIMHCRYDKEQGRCFKESRNDKEGGKL